MFDVEAKRTVTTIETIVTPPIIRRAAACHEKIFRGSTLKEPFT